MSSQHRPIHCLRAFDRIAIARRRKCTMAVDTIEATKQRARDAVARAADELVRISHEIHSHPELALKEHHAVTQLVPFLKAHGFERVERGVYDIETAFRAEWGHGPATIA